MVEQLINLDSVPLPFTRSLFLFHTYICTHKHTQVNQALVKVDEVIKEFTDGLKEKEIFDCVNFIIVSDHGELLNVVT